MKVRPLVNLRLDLKDEMKNTSFTLHTDLTSIQNINRLGELDSNQRGNKDLKLLKDGALAVN